MGSERASPAHRGSPGTERDCWSRIRGGVKTTPYLDDDKHVVDSDSEKQERNDRVQVSHEDPHEETEAERRTDRQSNDHYAHG